MSELPPGWFNELDQCGLEQLVSYLPKDPVIIEIGSFLGRSALIMAQARPDATIYCIDAWEPFPISESGYQFMTGYFPGCEVNAYERFLEYTASYPQIKPVRGKSPLSSWPYERANLVFIDRGDHLDSQDVRDDINFALSVTDADGVIGGHDFQDKFPAVMEEASVLSYRRGLPLVLFFKTVWSVGLKLSK